MTSQSILRSLVRLRQLERRCFNSRARFAVYRYLDAVYLFYERLRRTSDLYEVRKRLHDVLRPAGRKTRTHPLRLIFDLTSDSNTKIKSRWCRALRYAWRRRKHWKDLKTFLTQNGGIAGCAAAHSAAVWKPPAEWVRVGGEAKHAAVPLFIVPRRPRNDVELT